MKIHSFLLLSMGFPFATLAVGQEVERFPDFGYLPEAGKYDGKVFKLSQRYPVAPPEKAALPGFYKTDFQKDWKQYMAEVRSYCFDGNVGHKDIADDFRLEEAMNDINQPLRWFHMPWQHWGPMGREGIHGLTKEAPVNPYALSAKQATPGQTYAVAFYNEWAASAIGQVWKGFVPDATVTSLPGTGFPEGSVIFKLLFVTTPVAECDFLGQAEDCVQWDAYITKAFSPATNDAPRSIEKMTLIQMDIMVKDHRAPYGWIFGTYQYNSALKSQSKWDNLVPVGIMWSNDPNNTEVDPNTRADNPFAKKDMRELGGSPINPALAGTRINDSKDLPPTHLGWNGRLNGPVDNPMSSCMSCHQTAQYPFASVMGPTFLPKGKVPGQGEKEWMHWFRNLPCGTPFDPRSLSTDGSLQLAMSMRNFYEWLKSREGGYVTETYLTDRKIKKTAPPKGIPTPPPGAENQPILRDDGKN